jgi:hypothetical protein
MRFPIRLKLVGPNARISESRVGLFRRPLGRIKSAGLCVAVATGLLAFSAGPAFATVAAPGWTLDSVATPTNFLTASSKVCLEAVSTSNRVGCDAYQVSATNAGSLATGCTELAVQASEKLEEEYEGQKKLIEEYNKEAVHKGHELPLPAKPSLPCPKGSPTVPSIVLTDTPPQGVNVAEVQLSMVTNGNTLTGGNGNIPGGTTVPAPGGACSQTTVEVRCTVSGSVPPDAWLEMKVFVTVDNGVAEGTKLTNRATVSGGGGAGVATEATNEVNALAAPFGLSHFEFFKAGLSGAQESQAGGHPYELTTTIDLNSKLRNFPEFGAGAEQGYPASVQYPKDVVVDLPLGFAGSTLAAPECTEAQLDSKQYCPPDTVVGHLTTEPEGVVTQINSPLWNLVPEHGHPAEFGYLDVSRDTHVAGYVSVVPTPAGYVLRFVASDLPEVLLDRIIVTFYGDPSLRDQETAAAELGQPFKGASGAPQVPFFTNPTSCANGPQVAQIWTDSWADPASFQAGTEGLTPTNLGESAWAKSESTSPAVQGCDALTFTPELGAQPTTHEADKPTGLEFGLKLPQTELPGVPATPALKTATVKFPEGMTVDPSSADGLGTCSEAQIGFEGPTLFDFSPAEPQCPESSKIGSLELETPLIPHKLEGEMYLASQNANPFGSTFALYVVVDDPVTGVLIKLPGELKLNNETGQITSRFAENPQLPFSNLQLHFFGGPRAELATPAGCGIYQTNSELEPWSAPDSGPLGTPFDDYTIDENCPVGFSPHFTGGSTNLAAGAYTTFQASFERQDNEPELSGATVDLPPGMLANVSSVTECSQAQLQAEREDVGGGCPESSKVGTTTAGAGPGPDPLFVGGNVFWTGPYNGHGACTPGLSEPECAPFGLAVVVSANPGPFHFGNVVVRQRLFINKETASAIDVSDAFPTFLHVVAPNKETNGVPIKLRRVDVEINRPGFAFNSTNCSKETFKVGGDISSTEGQSSALATPFQVTNCAHLKFEPKFSVSVTGKNTKEGGSALTAKVTEPNVPQGTDAGIHLVKVELPVQLPSRLSTLQRACTDKQFNENPAGCPKESMIGMAVVSTPILPEPLKGPAIFVSHGGEAFPSLTLVLQGDGVTVDLVGTTYISSKSITSTTFKTVPDTPFSSFELTLPQGKFSALGTNVPEKDKYNLCGQKLVMPNEFIGQNGAAIHQKTNIAISGCGKTLTRAQKLAAAIKACHKDHKKSKRERCEKAARKNYGPLKKSKGKK